jgi:hypothetical protein
MKIDHRTAAGLGWFLRQLHMQNYWQSSSSVRLSRVRRTVSDSAECSASLVERLRRGPAEEGDATASRSLRGEVKKMRRIAMKDRRIPPSVK